MASNRAAIRYLAVGDMFHARSSNGASLVCIATALDDVTIYARRIHTQDDLKFDRATGFELGSNHTKIDCVTPFPSDIQKTFVDMDRKYQALYKLVRKGVDPDIAEWKLTPDEKRAHLSINSHTAANPVEDPDA